MGAVHWKKRINLVASAYRSYADGENAIDGVIETLSAMLRIEFENTKQKEDAESIGYLKGLMAAQSKE